MSKALDQAKSSLQQIAERFPNGPAEAFILASLAEIERLEAEDAEADRIAQLARLPEGSMEVLRQVHSRGFHGHTIEETARILLEASLVQFLPEKFEWCQADGERRVGIRRD